VTAAAQYRQLLALGRNEFVATAAPAALVRYGNLAAASAPSPTTTQGFSDEETFDETALVPPDPVHDRSREAVVELFPLIKKPGASFPDRITIGRASNNDIAIADISVSRLHAYVRRVDTDWVVADAGSKNGSWLRGERLTPRKEQPLVSRTPIRVGEIDLTFYLAADLYAVLGGKA
jgi:hypothetical protein